MKGIIIELVSDTQVPTKATEGSAGFDIHAPYDFTVTSAGITIDLGFKTQLPPNTAALILPRSGLGTKHGLQLLNTVGLIDSDYRGEWKAGLILGYREVPRQPLEIKKGDRILQFVVIDYPHMSIVQGVVDNTTRGSGGFGSTGV